MARKIFTTESFNTLISEIKAYITAAVSGKANKEHEHEEYSISQELTQAEYDALEATGKTDPDTVYYITDADPESGSGSGASSADKVSYDNSASGLEADNLQGAMDEISNDVSELNQNMGGNILTYNESEDAYYIQHGADSVPKKLGSGEITIPKIYLHNTANITSGGGKDVHMGGTGTTTSEFKISCKDHGTLKIERLTSSVSIVCQKANGSTVTKTYSVAGSALDISDYDYITLEPTCTTRITHAYSQSLSGSSSITLTNVVLS